MENETGEAPHHEALDADAVCGQCSTINAEGTLICRQCGNNLRDQRATRLQADGQLVGDGAPRQKNKIFTTLLSIMGVCLVVYTIMNQKKITDGLINMNSPKAKIIRAFWNAPDATLYDELLLEIKRDFPGSESIDAALEAPVLPADLNGFYIIVDNDGDYNDRDPMHANVYTEEGRLYFVARSRRNEIRGAGDVRGDQIILNMNDAVVDLKGERKLAMGYGTVVDKMMIECSGQMEDVNRQYLFYAIPVQ